jgi:REP element-mobilizing transposase RayT
MPRRPRVEVAGGVYHVYNRVGSGERVFANPEEAVDFVERIRSVKRRDGCTVFGWCVLSNHYHLAIRTSDVPLAASLHTLQGQFSRSFNRRWSRSGSLWQSRYHAKLIDEQRYLSQVVLYIHLNPVRAGLTEDPSDSVFSGHREIASVPGMTT